MEKITERGCFSWLFLRINLFKSNKNATFPVK